ncbi:aspartyl-phosphate phosphatase Spo0E family protein [Sporosarcina sp. BP05]|uniref:aspartyl-phosphate phosphatase Spo0E family protein n=1 Tax=Sporosarcina sp. BP05 TaxID=2758726 RepID=UPI0016484F38|nr:aspartyl-phosphate phosphatase Spo0E family protein [Sporosarcina sp. BP05]
MEWNLEEEIESLREKMMDAAIKKGLTAAETVEFSRKLDNIMDQYEELKKG